MDSEQLEEKRPRIEQPGNFRPLSAQSECATNISMHHCPTEEPTPRDETPATEEKETKEEVFLLLLYSYHPFTAHTLSQLILFYLLDRALWSCSSDHTRKMIACQMKLSGMCPPPLMPLVKPRPLHALAPAHSLNTVCLSLDTAVAHLAKFLSIQNQHPHLGIPFIVSAYDFALNRLLYTLSLPLRSGYVTLFFGYTALSRDP